MASSIFSGPFYGEQRVDYWAQRMYWEGSVFDRTATTFRSKVYLRISATVAEYVHIEIDKDSYLAFVDRFANPTRVETHPLLKGPMLYLPGGGAFLMHPLLDTLRSQMPAPPASTTAHQVLDQVCSLPADLANIVVGYYLFR